MVLTLAQGNKVRSSEINNIGLSAKNGVVSGLDVAAQSSPDMTVKINTAGVCYAGDKRCPVGAVSSLTIGAAHASYTRYDAIDVIGNTNSQLYQCQQDSQATIYGAAWDAQSFTTPATNFSSGNSVLALELLMDKVGSPSGNVTVGIQADAAGSPDGTDLATATVVASTLPAYGSGTTARKRILFRFTDTPSLTANTLYWIVNRATSGDGSNYVRSYYKGTASVYAGGTRKHSGNSGGSWSADANDDHFFIVYCGRVVVTAGTAAATPQYPDLPSDSIRLAIVAVPPATTTIQTGNLSDERVFTAKDWDFVYSDNLSHSVGTGSVNVDGNGWFLNGQAQCNALSLVKTMASDAIVTIVVDGEYYTANNNSTISYDNGSNAQDTTSVACANLSGPYRFRYRCEIAITATNTPTGYGSLWANWDSSFTRYEYGLVQ